VRGNKNQSGNIILYIVIAIVVVGVGIGVYLFLQNSKNKSADIGFVDSAESGLCSVSAMRASFTCPSGWSLLHPNLKPYILKSPNFKNSGGGTVGITSGSSITITSMTSDGDPFLGDSSSLMAIAKSISGSFPTKSDSVSVSGQNALRFSYSNGGNDNGHTVIIFVKNSKEYRFDQEYAGGSANPYPDVLDGIISTFSFK